MENKDGHRQGEGTAGARGVLQGEGQRCSPQVKQGFITMCFEGTSHGVVKEPIARDRKTEGKGGIA